MLKAQSDIDSRRLRDKKENDDREEVRDSDVDDGGEGEVEGGDEGDAKDLLNVALDEVESLQAAHRAAHTSWELRFKLMQGRISALERRLEGVEGTGLERGIAPPVTAAADATDRDDGINPRPSKKKRCDEDLDTDPSFDETRSNLEMARRCNVKSLIRSKALHCQGRDTDQRRDISAVGLKKEAGSGAISIPSEGFFGSHTMRRYPMTKKNASGKARAGRTRCRWCSRKGVTNLSRFYCEECGVCICSDMSGRHGERMCWTEHQLAGGFKGFRVKKQLESLEPKPQSSRDDDGSEDREVEVNCTVQHEEGLNSDC